MEQFWRENGYISLLVNSIPDIEKKSYLELGLGRGVNFSLIQAGRKVSVDVRKETNPTFWMSTDNFFEQNKEMFDVVYVDADHHFEQVVKDFNNALKICDMYLFLHDLVPPIQELISFDKCGDAYKLLFYLVEVANTTVFTLDTDCGLSFVRMPVEIKQVNPLIPFRLEYLEFIEWVNRKHHRYSIEEMIDLLKERKV